jgi:hypothetical protein
MDNTTNVFFYGLFMDESWLASMGIRPRVSRLGHVAGYGLHIGARATLVPERDSRSYGVVMEIAADQAAALYSDESVCDYAAEPVVVHLPDGAQVAAVCYNLPATKLCRCIARVGHRAGDARFLSCADSLGCGTCVISQAAHDTNRPSEPPSRAPASQGPADEFGATADFGTGDSKSGGWTSPDQAEGADCEPAQRPWLEQMRSRLSTSASPRRSSPPAVSALVAFERYRPRREAPRRARRSCQPRDRP